MIDDLAVAHRSEVFVTLGEETGGLRQTQGGLTLRAVFFGSFYLLPLYLLLLYLLLLYLQRFCLQSFYPPLTPINRHVLTFDGAGSTQLQDCGASRRSDVSTMQLDWQVSNTSDKVRCNPDRFANYFHALKAFQDFFPQDAQLHFR